MLTEDKAHVPHVIASLQDENKQKDLLIEDEEEDFLDEGKVILFFNYHLALAFQFCFTIEEVFLNLFYQALSLTESSFNFGSYLSTR